MSGEQEKCALIVPRRNFLIRALGFTAAGATIPVPVLALETPEARLERHIDGTIKELRALHPDHDVGCIKDILMHGYYEAAKTKRSYFGDRGIPLMFTIEHRERTAKQAEYERAKRELAQRFGM